MLLQVLYLWGDVLGILDVVASVAHHAAGAQSAESCGIDQVSMKGEANKIKKVPHLATLSSVFLHLHHIAHTAGKVSFDQHLDHLSVSQNARGLSLRPPENCKQNRTPLLIHEPPYWNRPPWHQIVNLRWIQMCVSSEYRLVPRKHDRFICTHLQGRKRTHTGVPTCAQALTPGNLLKANNRSVGKCASGQVKREASRVPKSITLTCSATAHRPVKNHEICDKGATKR